jgi:hypothetical protein
LFSVYTLAPHRKYCNRQRKEEAAEEYGTGTGTVDMARNGWLEEEKEGSHMRYFWDFSFYT